MNDLALREIARAQVVLAGAGRRLEFGARRATDRLRREQTGQDVIEYAGMIVLVAAVIVALFQLGIPNTVKGAVTSALHSIFGSDPGSTPAQGGSTAGG